MLRERTGCVLLVDSDAFFASGCASRLEEEGFSVACEGDAERGFEAVLRERPDTILLSAEQLSLLERVRNTPSFSAIPVVALAERGCPEEAERCLQAGARDYLVKAHLVSGDVARIVRSVLELN